MNFTMPSAATYTLPETAVNPTSPVKTMAWMEHLMNYKTQHPDSSLKECMKQAKLTYAKTTKPYVKKNAGQHKPNPWMQHIAAWKLANPDWKNTMSYKQVLVLCKDTYAVKSEVKSAVNFDVPSAVKSK